MTNLVALSVLLIAWSVVSFLVLCTFIVAGQADRRLARRTLPVRSHRQPMPRSNRLLRVSRHSALVKD